MNRPPEHDWDDLPGDEADPDDDLDVFDFVHEDADDDPDEARRLGAPAAAAGGRGRGLLRRRGTGSHPAAPGRSRRGSRLRGGIALGAAALAFLAVVVLVVQGFLGGADHDGIEGEELTFSVEPGEDLASVARRLDSAGVVASARAFERAAEDSASGVVRAGDFVMRERMPAADALAVLQGTADGAVHYVLVERGRRLTEVLDALAESTGLPREELAAATQDPARYGVPAEAQTLEGWLDPGEYRLPVEASAEEVVDALVRPVLADLAELGVDDPDEQRRVLTVASLLEAEVLPRDYRMAAGVIENRLAPDNTETRGMLEIDAAVTYGLGVRSLSFSAGQRQDASNPYNTYVHPGLPPGPIGMPSDAAVAAALDPADTDAYYWVTTDIATGHTEFSRTYEEHLEHVRTLQRYCASNPGVC
ncbi:endolytic transglycosylase MltG [Micrococcus endophyticus]|uniref:endolytic transglycosylase MltG n=1 Tax=Micrococcus endophyticus TaxID=455343 RepID=UPI0035A86232